MAESVSVYPSTAIIEHRTHLPGDKSVSHTPVADTQATITIPAGGEGVHNVITSFCFNLVADGTKTITAANVSAFVIDGATGGTTYLFDETENTGTAGMPAVRMTGLNLVGSANTATTLEFSALTANAIQSVNATYHQIGI